MRVWLDDLRAMPPKGYDLHAHNYREAIAALSRGTVTRISFDHDLGNGKTGYDVAKFIEKGAHDGSISRIEWSIHSANPVGRNNISAAMMAAEKEWANVKSNI